MPPTLLFAIGLPSSIFVIYAIWKSAHFSTEVTTLMGRIDDSEPADLLGELTLLEQRAEELKVNIAQLRSFKRPRTK